MNETAKPADFEEIVRVRAYTLWESEGRPLGRDAEHWRVCEEQARRELALGAVSKPKPKPAAKKKSAANKRAPAFAEAASFA